MSLHWGKSFGLLKMVSFCRKRFDPTRKFGNIFNSFDPLVYIRADGSATEANLNGSRFKRFKAQGTLRIPLDAHWERA
jgi:hypothetical protein